MNHLKLIRRHLKKQMRLKKAQLLSTIKTSSFSQADVKAAERRERAKRLHTAQLMSI